jgi:uncharacterized membrane protein YcjF (UPF0283 family)
MNDKKSKVFWGLVATGLIILFLLILTSSILDIGERLRLIHEYVEYTFYGVCVLLVWFLILNPIRIVLTSPSLSIVTTLEKDTPKAHQIYKSVTKNILKNNDTTLSLEERAALENYHGYDELRDALNLVMNGSVKKQINKIIIKNAKTVMLSTMISQNSKLDMISVVSMNLKMVKEIVVACGFRPSMKNLSKLTVNVASTALIAEGLESMRLEEVLPTQSIQALESVPLLKPIISSVTQGVANALLTIRIGLVTRGYLFTNSKKASKAQIRAEAFKDALIILPMVVGEVIAYFPSKVIKFFAKKNKDENEDVVDSLEEATA